MDLTPESSASPALRGSIEQPTYVERMRDKLGNPDDGNIYELIQQADDLFHEEDLFDQACTHYYEAIESTRGNAMTILEALDGLLTCRQARLQHEKEGVADLERMLAGYHFLFGTEDMNYLELALHVCHANVYLDRAEEMLPFYKRTAEKLLKTSTKECPELLFTGMEYFNRDMMTASELQNLALETLVCMEINGDFWEGFQMWFELEDTYSEKGMDDESDKCLLQALDSALGRPDLFDNQLGYTFLFVHLPKGQWTEANASLYPKFLKLEQTLRAHMETAGIGKEIVSCWINLATLFAKIGSLEDASRALRDADAALHITSPIERDIWSLETPYRGLRILWEVCANRKYENLAEQCMQVVLEAARRWLDENRHEYRDASQVLERFRERKDWEG